MGLFQRRVLPIAWLLVAAAAAAALVKLAFFPEVVRTESSASPTGVIAEPTIEVKRATITNDLKLQGTVAANSAVPVKATAAGTVDHIDVAVGESVKAGALLFSIRSETNIAPAEDGQPNEDTAAAQPKTEVTYHAVFAPSGGVVSALDVIQGEAVTVGAVAGQVAPQRFSITGSINPAQLYRIQTRPKTARITIDSGPAPFTCTHFSINTPLAGATNDTGGDSAATGSDTTFQCDVPSKVTVFSGLAAAVVLAGGKAEGVLVVPVTAVAGTAETGTVYVPSAQGTAVATPVRLGLTDGKNVEVVSGLKAGANVLQFVPGASRSS